MSAKALSSTASPLGSRKNIVACSPGWPLKRTCGVVAGFTHAELEDVDVSMDTISMGLRFSFGGDLQSRERAGADLGRTAAGSGGMAGALL